MAISNKKKILAAIAAVQAYIADEEACLMAQAAAPALAVSIPSTVNNLWGLAGRQAGMQMRVLLQRRSLR